MGVGTYDCLRSLDRNFTIDNYFPVHINLFKILSARKSSIVYRILECESCISLPLVRLLRITFSSIQINFVMLDVSDVCTSFQSNYNNICS